MNAMPNTRPGAFSNARINNKDKLNFVEPFIHPEKTLSTLHMQRIIMRTFLSHFKHLHLIEIFIICKKIL